MMNIPRISWLVLAVAWLVPVPWLGASTQPPAPEALDSPEHADVALAESLNFSEEVVVRLRPFVRSSAESLRLSDVAEFKGDNYALIARLADVELGPGPKIGAPLRIPRSRAATAVERAVSEGDELVFEGAQEVVVELHTMRIDIDALREELISRVKQELPYEPEQLVISQVQLPQEIVLPRGRLKLGVEFQFPGNLLGRTGFSALFHVNGNLAQRISGAMMVDAQVQVLRATRMIPRDSKLLEEDFKLTPWTQSHLPRNALSALPADEARATVRENIQPGEILIEDMIERPPLITRNSALSLVIRNGGLKVSATGVAQESGSLGQVIRARNVGSGREIFARVLDTKSAEVVF
jgi:flagella basal body P-ring formation protein FlgA